MALQPFSTYLCSSNSFAWAVLPAVSTLPVPLHACCASLCSMPLIVHHFYVASHLLLIHYHHHCQHSQNHHHQHVHHHFYIYNYFSICYYYYLCNPFKEKFLRFEFMKITEVSFSCWQGEYFYHLIWGYMSWYMGSTGRTDIMHYFSIPTFHWYYLCLTPILTECLK